MAQGHCAARGTADAATDDAGLWRFKDGAAIYAHKLKQFTTTNMTATEIHDLGLREVRRIEGDMDAILRKLGRTEGTVKQRMEKLAADLSYPNTSEGRTRIMADIDAMIRDADKRSSALFDPRPTAPVIAQALSRVPLGERSGELHVATARRIAARDLPDAFASSNMTKGQSAHARLSRNHSRTSLPGRVRRRESPAPEVPAGARAWRHLRHQRRLGALRRTHGGPGRLVHEGDLEGAPRATG